MRELENLLCSFLSCQPGREEYNQKVRRFAPSECAREGG